MTLAVENANSKLVDVVLFAGVDIQDRVDLGHIWQLGIS